MLFKTAAELKAKLGGLQKNMSEGTIFPFVEQASRLHVEPYLGATFLQELDTWYNAAPFVPDPQNSRAVELLQVALGYYAYLEAFPFLLVHGGDSGVKESAGGNFTPARQFILTKVEIACLRSADNAMDIVLEYLWENAVTHFPTLASSTLYQDTKKLLLSNAKEFSLYYWISNNRRAYLMLLPYIQRAEQNYILPITCTELLDEIKAQLVAGTLTGHYLTLTKLLRFALAQYAIAEAVAELPVELSGASIRFLPDNDAMRQSLAANADKISVVSANSMVKAQEYGEKARKFIYDHLDTFTQFAASDCFIKADEAKPFDYKENDGGPSFWT